ncbi:argonaute, partial [Thalictrum thalictroides]
FQQRGRGIDRNRDRGRGRDRDRDRGCGGYNRGGALGRRGDRGGGGDHHDPLDYPHPRNGGGGGGYNGAAVRGRGGDYDGDRDDGDGDYRGGRNTRGRITRSGPGLHQAIPYAYGNYDRESSSSQVVSPLQNLLELRKSTGCKNTQPQLKYSSSEFPSRPSVGRLGEQFKVHIQPEITSINRVVMDELVKSFLGNRLLAYDGRSSFYTARPLLFYSKRFTVSPTNEGGARTNYVVEIKLVSKIDLRNDISAAAFVQKLKVIDFVADILNIKEVPKSRQFSDAEHLKVCKIVGGQRYTKRLNETQVANMVKMNNKKPVERETSILEMVVENDYQNDEYAKEFGIRISKSPTSVQARILPSPQLSYHGVDTRPKCGQWNMKNQKMFEGGVVKFWRCLNFAQFRVSNEKATAFCQKLASSSNIHGMKLSSHPIDSLYNARPEEAEQALKTIQKETMTMLKGKELDLLIVILPNSNGSLYGEVKRICETQLGIISQCVLAGTAERMNSHTLANIVLKINTKVGGDKRGA